MARRELEQDAPASPGADEPARHPRGSPPTTRVLAVLTALTRDPDRDWTLNELARDAGLSTPTCLGIVNTLEDKAFVTRVGRNIRLGDGFIRLGRTADARMTLVRAARAQTAGIAARHGAYTVLLSIVGGRRIAIWDDTGPASLGVSLSRGQVLPPFDPPSLGAIAWLHDDAVEEWLQLGAESAGEAWVEQARTVIATARSYGFLRLTLSPSYLHMYRLLTELGRSKLPASTQLEFQRLVRRAQDTAVRSTTEVGRDGDLHVVSVPIFDARLENVANLNTFVVLDAGRDADALAHEIVGAAARITSAIGGTRPRRIERAVAP